MGWAPFKGAQPLVVNFTSNIRPLGPSALGAGAQNRVLGVTIRGYSPGARGPKSKQGYTLQIVFRPILIGNFLREMKVWADFQFYFQFGVNF